MAVVGAGAAVAEYAWKEWGIQALVLLSFTLQVVLLILAEFRRSTDSGVLRLSLWSAYLLADAAAIYVLGHMSVTGRSPEHKLVAFWAPFLLLHLGGQDNITAYAIEDNRLWLRHLQTFAVQVAAAAYVLYQSFILREAAVLMLVVGAVKYGERVWTLRCADNSPSGGNYRSFEPAYVAFAYSFDTTVSLATPRAGVRDTEALLVTAHLTLDVAKELFKGRLPYGVTYSHVVELHGEEVYKVVEMQLSLMHDALYTKLQVTRSWYGLCIRAFSVPSTAVALLLFHFHLHHRTSSAGDDRVDIAVTYVLLVGAVVLEAMGMLRAVFSSWMCALLATRCRTGALASVRRLLRAADWRRRHWSDSMGQLNLLELHARTRASRSSSIARCIGVEDTWNTLWHTRSAGVSSCIKELLLKQLLKSKDVPKASPDHILNSRGRAVLKGCGLHEALAAWTVDDDDDAGGQLGESILTWHVATNVYLGWYNKDAARKAEGDDDTAAAATALSDYMLFLLAARPEMLPPAASPNAFVEACFGMSCLASSSAEDLAGVLQSYGDALNAGSSEFKFHYSAVPTPADKSRSLDNNEALKRGCKLGAKLISIVMVIEEQDRHLSPPAADAVGRSSKMLELIAQVWVEMLCFAGHRCTAYSHAKQLGSGGELITLAALLVKYYVTLGYISHVDPSERSGTFSIR